MRSGKDSRALRASAETRAWNSAVTFKFSWQSRRGRVEIRCRSFRARGRVSRARRPFKVAVGRRVKCASSSKSSPSMSALMSAPLIDLGEQSAEAHPQLIDFLARLAIGFDFGPALADRHRGHVGLPIG